MASVDSSPNSITNCNCYNQCDYCGLPVPKAFRLWRRESKDCMVENKQPHYCCSGCRFADEVMREKADHKPYNRLLLRLMLAAFLSFNVMMFTMVLWSSDVYGPTVVSSNSVDLSLKANSAALFADIFRWLSLLLTLPVLWLLGPPLFYEAARRLRSGFITSDLLLIIGIGAAVVYSTVSVVRGGGAIYFEVACAVLVLVTVGRWLESLGKHRATQQIESLAELLPKQVSLIENDEHSPGRPAELLHRTSRQIPLMKLRVGNLVRVTAGERVPIDGIVRAGTSALDEQLITGESKPRNVNPEDTVCEGTMPLDGTLVIECRTQPGTGTIAKIIQEVRRAQLAKGCYQQLVDRISLFFLPILLVLATSVFAFYSLSGDWLLGAMSGLSVILIACPCALGIATPLAAWTALGRASLAQVLFRNTNALERLATIQRIALDKTGTLTTGEATVAHVIATNGYSSAEVLAHAELLANHSTHPISKAIVNYHRTCADEFAGEITSFDRVTTLPGLGLLACDGDSSEFRIAIGNARLMDQMCCDWKLSFSESYLAGLENNSITLPEYARCYVAWNGQVRGMILFHEQLRPGASEALAQLEAMQISTLVLSGDDPLRVELFAAQLPNCSAEGGLLPAEKVARLRELQQQKIKVAMVGDGVNDAPALAAADVGIALGSGADVARQSADVCLLGNDLSRLAWTIGLARSTMSIIRQNLVWAFLYNIVGIYLAITGRLNPAWAAAFMVISSLIVIVNSQRLHRFALPADVQIHENHISETQHSPAQQVSII